MIPDDEFRNALFEINCLMNGGDLEYLETEKNLLSIPSLIKDAEEHAKRKNKAIEDANRRQ